MDQGKANPHNSNKTMKKMNSFLLQKSDGQTIKQQQSIYFQRSLQEQHSAFAGPHESENQPETDEFDPKQLSAELMEGFNIQFTVYENQSLQANALWKIEGQNVQFGGKIQWNG